jgi:tRNA-guanine family transglycosylase
MRPELVEGRSLAFDELSRHKPVEVQQFGFVPGASLPGRLGRSGVITTPHGVIKTPAFIAVGTKATVKAVLPESLAALGAQAVLANAYHLYLQPGADVVEAAGGLGRFMNWGGPTFTDSGGFQVMSLGAGFKKILAMNTNGLEDDDVIAEGKTRLAHIDDDGVTFTSHLDGSRHRFTPEFSMQIQHQLGADIAVRLRRVHHVDEHPRLPGAVGRSYPTVGRSLPRRTPTAHQRKGAAALPSTLCRCAGRTV